MAVGQLPDQVREFARYLRDLLGRLDQNAGWCGVFWQRDPEGMRACLDGAEVPPWDVVQALLHDLAADRGIPEAERETGRARALHRASLDAYDARPGGLELLGDRLDMMLGEQRVALERQADLGRQLTGAADADHVERIHLDLAWVRDDHERATARCAELRGRMDRLTEARRPSWVDLGTEATGGDFGAPPAGDFGAAAAGDSGGRDTYGGPGGIFASVPADNFGGAFEGAGGAGGNGHGDAYGAYDGDFGQGPEREADGPAHDDVFAVPGAGGQGRGGHAAPADAGGPVGGGTDPVSARHAAPDAEPRVPRQEKAPEPAPARAGRTRRRPRGARFAGLGDGGAQGADGAVAAPAPVEGGRAPRGARFAPAGRTPAPRPAGDTADEADVRATAEAVQDLVRLRGEGRSGEAHGVLVEAAGWPAARLPLFAGELHRAGLGADWATLLWEAASLPPDRLVALADALAGAGRSDDCRKLLRQGVARPAPEIAEAVLALIDAGREREARALLDSYVRVRTSEDVARCAHTDPHRLIPLLLDTAQGVSDEHHWDLVHALRVAGFSA